MQALYTARITATEATVFGRCFFCAVDIFFLEEVGADTGIDVIPGKHLVQLALAVGIKRRVYRAVFKGLHPDIIPEFLAPGVESGAELPCPVDYLRQAAVAPGQDRFQVADPGVLPREPHTGFL